MYHRSKVGDYVDVRDIGTRQHDKVKFKVMNPSVKKAFRSPNYLGAQLWDMLPAETQLSGSYNVYKGRVARHIAAGMFETV